MPVVACPRCQRKIQLAPADLNLRIECAVCGTRFTVGGGKASPPKPSPPGEKTYYSGDDVRITSRRAVFGSQTYALRNITSVDTLTITTQRDQAMQWVVWSLILLLPTCGLSFITLIVGFILMLVAKDTHAVIVHTAGVEHRAFLSTDRSVVSNIASALNSAIIETD